MVLSVSCVLLFMKFYYPKAARQWPQTSTTEPTVPADGGTDSRKGATNKAYPTPCKFRYTCVVARVHHSYGVSIVDIEDSPSPLLSCFEFNLAQDNAVLSLKGNLPWISQQKMQEVLGQRNKLLQEKDLQIQDLSQDLQHAQQQVCNTLSFSNVIYGLLL